MDLTRHELIQGMKIIPALLLLFFIVLTASAQDTTIKFVTFNHVVEIVPASPQPDTSEKVLTIKTGGRHLKTAVLDQWFAPEVRGSIRYGESEYFVLQTSSGSGACSPGTFHVFGFTANTSSDVVSGVSSVIKVSPALNACGLAEDFVPLSFREKVVGRLILEVEVGQISKGKLVKVVYTLDLSTMDGWVDRKTGKALRN